MFGQYHFVENKGQWHETIRFKSDLPNGNMYVFDDYLGFYLMNDPALKMRYPAHESHGRKAKPHLKHSHRSIPPKAHTYKLKFINKSAKTKIEGKASSSTLYNFIHGNDPSEWAQKVKSHKAVEYTNIYNNIDFVIYGTDNSLKYEFKVAPNSNASKIKMHIEGARDTYLESSGALTIETSVGKITEKPPYAYQIINGKEVEVECNFNLFKDTLSFVLGDYNRSLPLVIDPELIFSSSSGSLSDNWGTTACLDNAGNLYSGGTVFPVSADPTRTFLFIDLDGFPATPGAIQPQLNQDFPVNGLNQRYTDMAILKFDSSGTNLIYATYIGGTDTDIPISTIANENEELYILGITGSSDFPGAINSFNGGTFYSPFSEDGATQSMPNGSDLILTKLSADGTVLINSRYIGGTGNDGVLSRFGTVQTSLLNNYGDQFRGDIFLDNDMVYVASHTVSTDFPMVNPSQGTHGGGIYDAVVCQLDDDFNTLNFSTYLGGTGNDAAYSIQVDSTGTIITTGGTTSQDFPVLGGFDSDYNGDVDPFITKINPNTSSIEASTYLGTPEYDQSYFVQLDNEDNIYVFGQTKGQYLRTPGTYFDTLSGQFIHSLTNDLSTTRFSTTWGSSASSADSIIPNISPTAFLVNNCGNMFFSGWGGQTNASYNGGWTANMPLQNPLRGESETDGSDFYLMAMDEDAIDVIFGTYFGGSQSAEHVDGGTSRFDKNGVIYQSVCANCGGFRDFPTFPDDGSQATYPKRNESFNCNNGFFKYDLSNLRAALDLNQETCLDREIDFANLSFGGEDYKWFFGDGDSLQTIDTDSVSHIYPGPGVYTVLLVATDLATCDSRDTARATITIYDTLKASGDTVACFDTNVPITFTGGKDPIWELDSKEYCVTCPSIDYFVTDSTSIIVTDDIDETCQLADTVTIDMHPLPEAEPLILDGGCTEQVVVFENNSKNGSSFEWIFGDGNSQITDTIEDVVHLYPGPGRYTARLIAYYKPFCGSYHDTVSVEVGISDPLVATPDDSLCEGDQYFLGFSGGLDPAWNPDPVVDCRTCPGQTIEVNRSLDLVVMDTIFPGCILSDTVILRNYIEPDANFNISQNNCLQKNVLFNLSASHEAVYEWDFGDGTTLTTSDPSPLEHLYKNSGFYTVTVTASDFGNCYNQESDQTEVLVVDTLNASGDTTACFDKPIYIRFEGGLDPTWLPSEDIPCITCPVNEIIPKGVREFIAYDSIRPGCVQKDTVRIQLHPLPNPRLSVTFNNERCHDSPIFFQGRVTNNDCECCVPFEDWNWLFGDGTGDSLQNPVHLYASKGTYKINTRATNGDTVLTADNELSLLDADSCLKNIFVPNAWTPNNDGSNDILYVRGINVIDIDFRVYDRWGEEVFRSNSLNRGWDGYFQGQKMKPQVFVFVAEATFYDGSKAIKRGNVTLIE